MSDTIDGFRAMNISYQWIKQQRCDAAASEFDAAQKLAQQFGLVFKKFTEWHYRLEIDRKRWEIFPGKLRIQRTNPVTPFIFGLGNDWTLMEVVKQAANTLKAWDAARTDVTQGAKS